MSTAPILDAIASLRKAHPRRPFVVLVPTVQQGHSLTGALARRCGQWHGVRAVPPSHLARDIAAMDLVTSGRTEVLSVGRLFHAAEILSRLAPTLQDTTAPGAHHLARTVAQAVHTLRLDGVAPGRIREYAAETGTDGTMQVVADGYEAYMQVLKEQRFFDEATIFEWAEKRVRNGTAPGVGDTTYVVLNGVDLPQRAYRFVDTLREHGAAFIRTGVATPHRAPRESAMMRFPDAETKSVSSEHTTTSSQASFVRAVGALSEADAVMRDILEGGVPFDDITVAYTTPDPYASLLADRAGRAGIPALSGAGQPALLTRTGRALNHLYEWVRDDFTAPVLVSMLRDGAIRLDNWKIPDDGAPLSPAEAASMIAGRSYESGRMGLLTGLQRAVHLAEQKAANETSEHADRRLRKRRTLFSLVLTLADLIQSGTRVVEPNGEEEVDEARFRAPVTLADIARGSIEFLETFGPEGDSSDKPEEERTLDEAGRRRLYEELLDLRDNGANLEAASRRIASLLQKWITTQNVQPQRARPGHVHILPLDSVGYSDRSHLFVVGMDSASFDAPVGENGLLGESDRHILKELDAEARNASLTAADELLWRAEQALARHRGPIAYYTRTFDVNAGEECDPSAFFLAKERYTGETATRRTATLIPTPSDVALADRDAWLMAYVAGRNPTTSPGTTALVAEQTARERLADVYPRILDGEAARAAQASAAYTEHDGMLPAGTYADLDLFANEAGPVSASRLQTLAEAPYIYFLQYVLGVRPLDEPALDDEPWLNSLRKGTLLHAIYERFVRDLNGRVPTASDEPALLAVVDDVLGEEAERFEPPSEMVRSAARRELAQNARVFFRAEMERDPNVIPQHFELGFGTSHESSAPYEAARLSVDGDTMHLQGKIDRVDRDERTGALTIWDYKTGKAGSYDESNPLQDGKTLQWALYAFALEALTGETVEHAGYFFANTQEVGARIRFSPAPYRAETTRILSTLRALTRTGTFPVTPRLKDVTSWKWNGYDRLVQNLDARRREVRPKAKAYPEDRPKPPGF